MKVGDIVKYKECHSPDEEKIMFKVIEDRGNRVLIIPINLYNLEILPEECVRKTDLTVIKKSQ